MSHILNRVYMCLRTYKRLISETPSVEDQVNTEEVKLVEDDVHCLCRYTKKSPCMLALSSESFCFLVKLLINTCVRAEQNVVHDVS